MANQYRGQTPFRALGREMYVVYMTKELAEAWSALGFRRADPLAPPVAEERDEPVRDTKTGDPVYDALIGPDGQPVTDPETGEVVADRDRPRFVRRRVLLDAAGRQQRMQDAFDAVFTNPDIPARRTCIRIGLQRWEQEVGQKLTADEFEQLCDELGLEGLSALHVAAFINATRVPPLKESGSGRDPNASSAAPASSTSSTS